MKHRIVSRSVFPALLGVVLLLGCVRAVPTPVPPTLAPTTDPGPIQTAAAGTAVADFVRNLTATAAVLATRNAEQVSQGHTATAEAAPLQTAAAATATALALRDATATAAAIPTATVPPSPSATQTEAPTATPKPTSPAATKVQPTAIPAASYQLTLDPKGYEEWGRPVRGCSAFDNGQPVRKFNINITLKNDSDKPIEGWYPDFFTNSGGNVIVTCFYVYGGGFPPVPPGEARTVTFASFVEKGQYVSLMVMPIGDQKARRCFSDQGAVVGCP